MLKLLRRIIILLYTKIIRYQFGRWGAKSRIELHAKLDSPHLVYIANNVYICEHAWLNANDDRGDGAPTLMIAEGVYIGRFVQINAWQKVVIEKNVLIADRVFISDADHRYDVIKTPILLQGAFFKGAVNLKEGCWLGTGCCILPGVTVGKNSVVAANSVVTKDVPDYTVVAGAPGKIIKSLERNFNETA